MASEDSTPAPLDQVQRWSELALGMAELLTGYSQRTLADATQASQSVAKEDAGVADVLRIAPGASVALALRGQAAAMTVAASATKAASWLGRTIGVTKVTKPAMSWLHSSLAPLDEEFKANQAARAEVAETFLTTAGPHALQEMLSRVDLNALLAQVDVEQLLDQIDVDALLDRIDIDRLADRIDVERLLDRIDINDVANLVIHDLEVTGLLRGGTEAIASSTVGVLRSQVEGVSRRLGRRSQPSTAAPAIEPGTKFDT